ncbi:MAG TPA: LPS assembly protein LptD [Candidatus Aminicenantes bacterium]|nr:LPS assembly protein LptD [Candidatus Aminicenantes bacterium]
MEFRPFRPALSRLTAAVPLAALSFLAALSAQTAPPPQAAPQAPPGGPAASSEVRITARAWERAKDRVFAAGDVELRCGDILLLADRVEYDLSSKDVLAEGNVVAQSAGQVVRAERVRFNLESGRGTVEKATGLIPPFLLFEAESLERKRADLYELRKGRITACAQPNPRWSFGVSRGRIETDDHMTLRDAVLRIKSVPVLYVPYLRYPLKDRATGFLMPRLGFGGAKGLSLSQSFYWAIAPNMDATAGVDLYLSRGAGASLEYRYLFPGGTRGDLSLYYFVFKRDASGARPGNSSIVRINHTQALPLGFSLVAAVDQQTSYGFLREFDDSFQRALTFTRTSQAYLSRSWRRFNVSARVSRFETYFSEVDDANVSTALPQLAFNVFKTRLFAPLYFSLTSSFSRTQYGWKSAYEAGTERRSTKLAVSPTLSLPFASIPWLTATTSVTANLAYYGQSLEPGSGAVADDPFFAGNVKAGIEIVGPVFFRLFYGRDGRARLKNIVEPYLDYSYDSPTRRAGRIVTDYGFFRYHQMGYGVTGRFLFKTGDRTVEVFSLGLGQTYYFSPEDGPLSRFSVDGRPPRFSEVAATLRFYPQAKFSFDAAAAYNPYHRRLSSLRLGATVGARADGDFLTVSWFSSRDSWATGVDPGLIALYNRDQVGASAGLRLPALGVDLQAEADYNIRERKLLYTGAQLVCHWQCLDFLVDVRAYYFRERPDVQVRFSLGLGAIGRTLGFLQGFGT